ncbi:class I adenylate-forming enzyme family protein [Granulicoccus sp. GXG6511]|uniref:class I adenylate-forming enzyme family protein n=1 Tax=Granulicoccus sp. GXG6511 TaxID=3381351 RepID=UPI003D7ED681
MSSKPGAHTLFRWVSDRARMAPDSIAIEDRGVRTTYGELYAKSRALSDAFAAAGYGRGHRIATLSGNSADQVILFFACADRGMALVPLMWRLTPFELADQLERSAPQLVVVEDEYADLGAEALARLSGGSDAAVPPQISFAQLTSPPTRSTGATALDGPAQDEDPILVIFTSGSSGKPKAAPLTQANCFWNNLSFSRTIPMSDNDVLLAFLPQFHSGGWNIQTLLAFWVGATVVLERAFDAGRVLSLIESRGITTFIGVPATYQMLAEHPTFADTDLSSLGTIVVGGGTLPVPQLQIFHDRGIQLCQGYGLTEASPNVLCLPARDAMAKHGSSGKPYPYVDCAVADPVTHEILDGEATGELLVAGPGVFPGYLDDPEATAATMHGEWLLTGDMVHRDADGFYFVVDRIKDMFKSGGENVSPTEVEDVLRLHQDVLHVAVVGIRDDRWGEVGKAFVVLRDGGTADESLLRAHCVERLAKFKVPKAIEFVAELPFNALNKVRRFTLRDEETAKQESGGDDG